MTLFIPPSFFHWLVVLMEYQNCGMMLCEDGRLKQLVDQRAMVGLPVLVSSS